MKYTIEANTLLFEVLSHLYPDSSNATLRQMLKAKRVSIDGQIVTSINTPLSAGQEVSVDRTSRQVCPGVDILYQDQDLIVVNKPVGLLSVPLDKGGDKNLLEILRSHYKSSQIYAVHRIDKGTSGVIAFARGKRSTGKLTEIFRNHNLKREYLAIVVGSSKEDHGTWRSLLVENHAYETYHTQDAKQGRLSITHFTVLKRSKNFSYLRLNLETGRKHQIRVHCKEAGHPVVGDKRYGDPLCNPISRMALHASSLSFSHPFSGKKMHFLAPLPRAFIRLGFPDNKLV